VPREGITFAVDAENMESDIFQWIPAQAAVLLLEYTMTLKD
jgi:hypothetical protein